MTQESAVAPTLEPNPYGDSKPLRADAQRNRDRIIAAAREAFGEEGMEIHMEVIAKRAGVGVGTLYRHFPTKHALIADIAREGIMESGRVLTEALAMEDPWEALTLVIYRNAEIMARDTGFRDIFGPLGNEPLCPKEQARLTALLTELINRAQHAAVISPELAEDDIQALLCGLSTTIARNGNWRRYAEILLTGIRNRHPNTYDEVLRS